MALITVIAAYDVSNDARRARLAALLQAYGDRIQRSVFVLTLTTEHLSEVRTTASALIDSDDDSFYLIKQCAPCRSGIEYLGQAAPPTPELFWLVM